MACPGRLASQIWFTGLIKPLYAHSGSSNGIEPSSVVLQ